MSHLDRERRRRWRDQAFTIIMAEPSRWCMARSYAALAVEDLATANVFDEFRKSRRAASCDGRAAGYLWKARELMLS